MKRVIDLSGPDGNAFWLLGMARQFAKQLGRDGGEICARMRAGDYDNLVRVFEQEFGDYVELDHGVDPEDAEFDGEDEDEV